MDRKFLSTSTTKSVNISVQRARDIALDIHERRAQRLNYSLAGSAPSREREVKGLTPPD